MPQAPQISHIRRAESEIQLAILPTQGVCGMEDNMKIVVLDAYPLKKEYDNNMEKFEKLGEMILYDKTSPEQTKDRLEEHNPEIIITNKVLLNEEVLKNITNLKLIVESATGFDNVDVEYAKSRNIAVSNVAGYSTDSVAQHTFAMYFYVMEHLRYYDDYVKSGEYSKISGLCQLPEKFTEISGKTWGIIGLGAIGRKVAQIATAFGAEVIYYSASGRTYDSPYKCIDLDTLLKESDIISIHAPLNDKTYDLINMDAFEKMKKSAILINVGRGSIVNEADLTVALEEGKILAAGLDVLSKEPIEVDNPLNRIKDSSKLLITPHMAWGADDAKNHLVDGVYEDITAYLNGELKNRVDL